MISNDDVIWAYRLFLDREPESEAVILEWIGKTGSRAELAQLFASCDEYKGKHQEIVQSPFWHYHSSFDAVGLIRRHAREALQASPLHVTNFLGVRIRPEVLPDLLSGQAGVVEPLPIPANWHADIAEWGSCLRALDLSKNRFVMLELGCGWGCWMNNLGVAAKFSGRKIKLYGIEADDGHLRFARQALSDNKISGDEFDLVSGIAGKAASIVLFPKIESGIDWGGTAIFSPSKQQLKDSEETGKYIRIPVVDIESLLRNEPVLDFLHVDIQGAELDLLTEIFELLCGKVRYIFIGTHSKQIEAGLFDLFARQNTWKLEMERPAIFQLIDGRPVVTVDGVQAWRNRSIE